MNFVFENGLTLSGNFRKKGDELLLFIHGLGCTKGLFVGYWKYENEVPHSVLAIDLLGHGESAKPANYLYRVEDHAESLKKLLTQITFTKLHLVAHSMGGAIGLLLGEDYKEKISTFINVEGNLIGADCGLISRKTAAATFEEFTNHVFADIQAAVAATGQPGSKLWGEVWTKETDPKAFWLSAKSLLSWSESGKLLPMFNGLKSNKMYIYGEKSGKPKVLQGLDKTIKTVEISDSGHFPMNDNPDEFYKELVSFLLQQS